MLTTELFPYQSPAVDYFLDVYGLLLAFDTGLGKTVTALAMVEEVLARSPDRTTLIICPASLRLQWAQAIAEHTDVETMAVKVRKREIIVPTERWCAVVGGTTSQRKTQMKRVIAARPQFVIMGYETAVAEIRKIRKWADMVIIDEATVLSSFTSRRSKKLATIEAPYRLALTATPVEHKPENIYKILQWTNPGLLGDFADFDKAYIRRNQWGRPTRYINLDVLHEIIQPAMIRKTIEDPDVAPYMPETRYDTWHITMGAATKRVYAAVATDLANELAALKGPTSFDVAAYYGGYDEGSAAGKAMAVMSAAQQLLNHPHLVRKSAMDFLESEGRRANGGAPKNLPGSAYSANLVASGALDGLRDSRKFEAVVSGVLEILAENPAHKVVLVSRYKGMQELFEKALPGFGCVRYHGEMTESEKAAAAHMFNQDPDCRVMTMSHSGVYGVDLPGGSHLAKYEPSLSAGQDKQLNGRIRRASSEHKIVHIVDVVTDDSIETRDQARLRVKGDVAAAIVDGDGSTVQNSVDSLTYHAQVASASI